MIKTTTPFCHGRYKEDNWICKGCGYRESCVRVFRCTKPNNTPPDDPANKIIISDKPPFTIDVIDLCTCLYGGRSHGRCDECGKPIK